MLDIHSVDKTVFLIDRKDLEQQTTSAFLSYAHNDVITVDPSDNVKDLQDKLSDKNNRQMIVATRQKLQILIKNLRANQESKLY